MDSFLSNSFNKKPTTTNNDSNKPTHEHKTTSTSELFASAKTLAEAAKGGGEQNKDKIADAAGDLLGAASQYGKIDETSAIGKSVHQAEEYLHNYNSSSSPPSSQSSTTTNTTNPSDSIPSTNTINPSDSIPNTNTSESTPNTNTSESTPNTNTTDSTPGSDGGSQTESGYGSYMNMAKGLFK